MNPRRTGTAGSPAAYPLLPERTGMLTCLLLGLLALAIYRLPPDRKPAGVIVALFLALIRLCPQDAAGRIAGPSESLSLFIALGVGAVLVCWRFGWALPG